MQFPGIYRTKTLINNTKLVRRNKNKQENLKVIITEGHHQINKIPKNFKCQNLINNIKMPHHNLQE